MVLPFWYQLIQVVLKNEAIKWVFAGLYKYPVYFVVTNRPSASLTTAQTNNTNKCVARSQQQAG